MTKDFYIFRHGQSTYNLYGRTQGQTNDSVLTDLGCEQAIEVGEKLQDKNVEIIVTSPLKRALQTTDLANKSLNVSIQEDAHFIEIDVGVVEGMHHDDICRQYGELFQKMHSRDACNANVCYPGGETRQQVRKRVFEGLENWAENSKYSTIAISSHGIMLEQLILALGEEFSEIKNGSILHIRKEKNQWKVVEWL